MRCAKDRSKDVTKLLDGTRKHCNSNYKGVVVGARPSRAQKSDQQVAASISRQSAKEFWLAKIKGEL